MLACSICKVSPPFLYAPIRGLSSVLVTKAEKFVFTLYVPRPFTQVYTGCLVTESKKKEIKPYILPPFIITRAGKELQQNDLKKHTYPIFPYVLLACSIYKVSPPLLYAPICGFSSTLVTKAEIFLLLQTLCPPALNTCIHGLPCY